MSIQKKSLINTLKTTKKANAAANPKEGLKAEKSQSLKFKVATSPKLRPNLKFKV